MTLPMTLREHEKFRWMDLIWLIFLGGLAVLPPIDEIHKQLILAAIAALQLSERWIISSLPQRGRAYVVILKILLATLLLDHTGEIGINSSYYPIYYIAIVTAAALKLFPKPAQVETALVALRSAADAMALYARARRGCARRIDRDRIEPPRSG